MDWVVRAMRKILTRLLKWRSDPAAPTKRAAPAHEIALAHAETRLGVQGTTESPSGKTGKPPTPESQLPAAGNEAKRVRRKQTREDRQAARATPLADGLMSERNGRRGTSKNAGQAGDSEDAGLKRRKRKKPSFI